MLSNADAAIASCDPALPGLRVILDPEALLAAFRAARPDDAFEDVDVTYVKYRSGKSCLVGCQVGIAGSRVAAYATTYSCTSKAAARLENARRSRGVSGFLGPGRFMLADSATVVSVFPNDSEVTALPMIGQPNGRPRVLKEMLPTRERLCRGAVEPLAYTPERRFVAKLVGSDGSQAVVKAYSDRAYRSSFASRPSFVSRGPLRVAATLARSDRYRTVILEWLGGRLLSEAMLDPGFDVNLAGGVGRSLAELHAQALTGRTRVTPGATLESLRAEATKMGRLCPALHARACELAEQLGACLRDRPPVYRPLHGDFHARQVVLDADAVAFLDFDGAFDGDPAFDLCSFLAGLARAVVRGSLAQRCAAHVAQALVDGYEAATGLAVQERMPLTLAIELFCLARRSFRGREPNWPEAMAAMLDRAEAATARASRPTPSDRSWMWLFDTPSKEAHG